MQRLISIVAGLLFGAGMIISGMSDPKNVIAFLDVTGHWSPDLAFVMGGALLVFSPSYWLIIRKRKEPVCADSFGLSDNKKIDGQLLSGAALFGLGWGIAGICPGPAIASMANGSYSVLGFAVTMLVGMFIGDNISRKENGKQAA
ncbi:hypothetical protein VME0621_00290 [Vibrio mediterranei]|uniref:YeeE/YedE family protein n=1 Tax=Vibrio mediterranei TaxID=689 RepID=UPI000782DEEC|nr:YeeE/YedE family protein [Vibrio mediterranei]MCG9662590.1 YeeE/YedE family protein [Vibrio mediterranei]SBO08198.1 hypothetical protein VME0621_00290 [Vibrio mediterranei]